MPWSTMINTTSLEVCAEEIQISENEMASDPDRHRSLNKYRRVPYAGKTTNRSIFSHAGYAVMLL